VRTRVGRSPWCAFFARKVDIIAPRSRRIDVLRDTRAGYGVYVLGAMPGMHGLEQLARLRQRVVYPPARKAIDGALDAAAARLGLAREDLDDLAIPTFDLVDGRGLPLYGVNHLAGHALTPRLTDEVAFPYLMLLVSGGHCQFLAVEGPERFRPLGGPIDDLLQGRGEAEDARESLGDFGGNNPYRVSLWREITSAAGRSAITVLSW